MFQERTLFLLLKVVPVDDVLNTAQRIAEEWVAEKRPRKTAQMPGEVETLLRVNLEESRALANAITDFAFMVREHLYGPSMDPL
jgi:hypothetical protein